MEQCVFDTRPSVATLCLDEYNLNKKILRPYHAAFAWLCAKWLQVQVFDNRTARRIPTDFRMQP